ncbi:MAG: hypothetical protein QOE71_3606 [Pseudonocardiales bacterium]|jgi:hypothetical protein|nr:hypothetical protein [Pseudonocardiales bacterium]
MALMDEVDARLKPLLIATGWKRRGRDIFTRPTAPDFEAWFALNWATNYRPYQIYPQGGARCVSAERLATTLSDQPNRRYTIATVSRPVYIILGLPQVLKLLVDGPQDVEEVAIAAAALANSVVVPFSVELSDYQAMLNRLETGDTNMPSNGVEKRMVCLSLVSGQIDRGVALAHQFIDATGDGDHPAYVETREFMTKAIAYAEELRSRG